jgi:hypothetical protein
MPEESTTPDPIALARLFNEAFNRRDWDAVESFYAPDAVAVAAKGVGTFEGAAVVRGVYEEAASFGDDFHIEIEEIIDLGNGATGHPVGSSGELRMRTGNVVSWTEALIERETGYMDIDEARAAAERLAQERG